MKNLRIGLEFRITVLQDGYFQCSIWRNNERLGIARKATYEGVLIWFKLMAGGYPEGSVV